MASVVAKNNYLEIETGVKRLLGSKYVRTGGDFICVSLCRVTSECANLCCESSADTPTKEATNPINFTFFLAELLFNMKVCPAFCFSVVKSAVRVMSEKLTLHYLQSVFLLCSCIGMLFKISSVYDTVDS